MGLRRIAEFAFLELLGATGAMALLLGLGLLVLWHYSQGASTNPAAEANLEFFSFCIAIIALGIALLQGLYSIIGARRSDAKLEALFRESREDDEERWGTEDD